MHSKGNWILRRDCQAKGRNDFYNCHSPLWGSQWIFDLPLQKQRPANLEKFSPQGKIVLNSKKLERKCEENTTERKWKFGNGNDFLAGIIYRVCAS